MSAANRVDNPCRVPGCERNARQGAIVCGGCDDDGRLRVGNLRIRWEQLGQAIVPSGGAQRDRISRPRPGSRAPVAVAAFDARERVEVFAARLDATVRQVLGQPPRRYAQRRRGRLVVEAREAALTHWPRVMVSGAAPELLHELRKLYGDLDRTLGLDELVHRLAAPCPACQLVTLTRRNGDDVVRCAACGSSWHEREYRHLVRVLAAELGEGA